MRAMNESFILLCTVIVLVFATVGVVLCRLGRRPLTTALLPCCACVCTLHTLDVDIDCVCHTYTHAHAQVPMLRIDIHDCMRRACQYRERVRAAVPPCTP